MEFLGKLGGEKDCLFLKGKGEGCDNSHPHDAFVKFKCVSKNADQEKITVYGFEAETIGIQFILCLRLSGTYPHAPPPSNLCLWGEKWQTQRERRRRRTTQGEREKASSLCSSASEKQLYYITVSGLGSSHAFKEEAHVPLHLKSHGTVGEDGNEVETWEQTQEEKKREKNKSNVEQNTDVSWEMVGMPFFEGRSANYCDSCWLQLSLLHCHW